MCGSQIDPAKAHSGKSCGQNKSQNENIKKKGGRVEGQYVELNFVNVGTFLPVSSTALAKVLEVGCYCLISFFDTTLIS